MITRTNEKDAESSVKRLHPIYQALSLGAGGFLAVFAILGIAAFLKGHPTADVINSAYGIFSSEEVQDISEAEQEIINELIDNEKLLTTDGFLAQINSFYTTLIGWTLSLFVAFGFISFFIIRQGNRVLVEDFCLEQIRRETDNYWGHGEFAKKIDESVERSAAEFWGKGSRVELDEIWQRMEEFDADLAYVRLKTSLLDETEEEGSDNEIREDD